MRKPRGTGQAVNACCRVVARGCRRSGSGGSDCGPTAWTPCVGIGSTRQGPSRFRRSRPSDTTHRVCPRQPTEGVRVACDWPLRLSDSTRPRSPRVRPGQLPAHWGGPWDRHRAGSTAPIPLPTARPAVVSHDSLQHRSVARRPSHRQSQPSTEGATCSRIGYVRSDI